MTAWVSRAERSVDEISAWALARGEWVPEAVRSAKWEFAADRNAPAEARHALLGELGELLSPTEAANLELVVSELVTNAIRHTSRASEGDVVNVYAAVAPDRLRIEVCDPGCGFPPAARQIREFGDGFGGVGLVLLDRLATVWGTDRDEVFCVWAEFERPGTEVGV